MNTLLTVWRLLDRKQQRKLVALQAVSVVMALSTVVGLAPVLPFFSALSDPESLTRYAALRFFYQAFHFTDPHQFVVVLGLFFIGGIVLANGVNLLGSLAIDRFAFQVGEAFHNALFDEYLHRSYGFHASTNSSLLSSNVLHETGRVTTGILRYGLILVTQIVTVAFIVASMLFLNPAVAGLTILGLGSSYGVVYTVARGKLRREGLLVSREYAKRTRIVNESLGAIKEIILLRAQKLFVSQFERTGALISKAVVNTFAISQTPRYLLECATVCVLVVLALYSSGNGRSAGPWIAQLSFMGLAVYRLLPSLQQGFLAVVRIRADRAALDSVVGDLQQALTRESREERAPLRTPVNDSIWRGRPAREIVLRDLVFQPTANRPPILANLTLRIPAGAVIGLIGANGSGKTTLVDVLSGLLVPQSGEVEIDGIALTRANRTQWQSTLAYVPQSVFICDCTVAENVALGVPAERIDPERIRAALRLARLDDYVSSLPKGYDEPLGERGIRMSGGQRQRLGIARALYRDASLLIMDEPTSALDADAEREVIDMLVAQRAYKTIVLITHRLESLRHCDRVYELAGGRIVRSMTYDELSSDRDNISLLRRAQAVSGVNASSKGRL
jgi:ABC-type multidrug transport system fused ATPase/permease subunit